MGRYTIIYGAPEENYVMINTDQRHILVEKGIVGECLDLSDVVSVEEIYIHGPRFDVKLPKHVKKLCVYVPFKNLKLACKHTHIDMLVLCLTIDPDMFVKITREEGNKFTVPPNINVLMTELPLTYIDFSLANPELDVLLIINSKTLTRLPRTLPNNINLFLVIDSTSKYDMRINYLIDVNMGSSLVELNQLESGVMMFICLLRNMDQQYKNFIVLDAK